MSTLTIAWSMCAGACAMLGLMHLLIGFKSRMDTVYLLSALMAFSAAANALIEQSLLHTQTVERFAVLLKWENTAVFVLLMALVWFVKLHFKTARPWLAVMIAVCWSLALVVNFFSPGSIVFTEVAEIKRLSTFWGEAFSVGVGPTNPWKLLPDVTSLLILIYVLDASIRVWRSGNRKRAIVVGGGIVLFITSAGIHAPLVDAGLVETPYMISFSYLAIVMAMSYELVSEAVQSARYARQIQAGEERWRTLLENVQMAVLGIDPEGRINYANPFLTRAIGYEPNALLDRPFASLVMQSAAEDAKSRFRRTAESGPRPHSRWALRCAAGGYREFAWSSVRLLDSEREFAGILSIGEDITDKMRTERELRKTQREMERMTRVNMLGELASALAHELNQPLAAILSNAQAARRFLRAETPDLNELREILEDIILDGKRSGECIHRMRAMLRRGEIVRELLSLNELVQATIKLVDSELSSQQMAVKTCFEPQLPLVEAGRIEIQQVVMNLLLNAMRAMKATPLERREIRISTSRQDQTVAVTVEDNGPGVPAANLPRIFDIFFTTRPSGLGVGLAICRRIVEAHGGSIRAENAAGAGARCTFLLPRPRPA